MCKAGGIDVQVLLGSKPAALDTPWKPAKDTELILSLVAAVQAQHWPVLGSISIPERFSKAWDFYLLVWTRFWRQAGCMHAQQSFLISCEIGQPHIEECLQWPALIGPFQFVIRELNVPAPLQGKQTAASLQVKRSPRTRSAIKKRDSLGDT